jgi:hypothetical protein
MQVGQMRSLTESNCQLDALKAPIELFKSARYFQKLLIGTGGIVRLKNFYL